MQVSRAGGFMVSFDNQRVFLGLPLVDFQDKKRKSMILN